ncbi:MAG: hypothetical protein SVQ76_02830 [Candidatus Nanohaloarchaea archaeon]|nr:hypothetical protein [Candidatus Nanohaloarchaea archaeon]
MSMDAKDWALTLAETGVWYGFFYYLLFAIKQGTTIWKDAAVLLALSYLGILLCPWVHRTEAWEDTFGDL